MSDVISLVVWQVTLTTKQDGQEDSTCNVWAFPAYYGGIDLGERNWGDEVDVKGGGQGQCYSFALNTQITGAMDSAAGIPTTGYLWYQEIQAYAYYTDDGTDWDLYVEWTSVAWVPDGPQPVPSPVDCNSVDTDNPPYEDVNEIYLRDAPNIGMDNLNDDPDEHPYAIGLNRNVQLRTYLRYDGYGDPIVSNECERLVQMEIERDDDASDWHRTAYQDRSGD